MSDQRPKLEEILDRYRAIEMTKPMDRIVPISDLQSQALSSSHHPRALTMRRCLQIGSANSGSRVCGSVRGSGRTRGRRNWAGFLRASRADPYEVTG